MTKFVKTGSRTGIVLSLTAAGLIAPEVILAGPGCMNNQRMPQGSPSIQPHGASNGVRTENTLFVLPGTGGMMATPYNRPMTALHSTPAVVGKPAVVAKNTGQSTPTAASGTSTPASETVSVRIDGMRFDPENIAVKPGTTITWVHGSQMPHTISGNADGISSGTLYKGKNYSHTFNATGRYSYVCDLHPSMTGSVVVEQAGTDS